MPRHARQHSAVSCAKMAEPTDLLFGLCTQVGLKEAKVQSYSPGGANVPSWQGTLAPPGEFCSSDAAFCQITLTTCLLLWQG